MHRILSFARNPLVWLKILLTGIAYSLSDRRIESGEDPGFGFR